ncbi:unnamed protein product [Rhizophagus irregularis]|nr:unnamed protein product [Rhizophagus irregularis]
MIFHLDFKIFIGQILYIEIYIVSGLIFNILDGARPEITEDTPECYTNLMKSCWDSDPKKRPSIVEICNICRIWIKDHAKNFTHAELKRKKLIKSKKLGPKFAKKPHPKSIYISRSLSSYISKCSSINFSSNDYISNEIEFDIDIESNGSNVIKTKRNTIEELSINSCENNGKRIKVNTSYSRTFFTISQKTIMKN